MTNTRERPARFGSETEERAFWETHDSSAHVDWERATRIRFPNLKPSTKAISLRLPVDLLERIKVAANQRDVPYQSLIKVWLAERVDAMQPREELSASLARQSSPAAPIAAQPGLTGSLRRSRRRLPGPED